MKNVNEIITQQVIEQLEKVSATDFKLPWKQSGRLAFNPVTKKSYTNTNAFMCMIFQNLGCEFATYKQWESMGAQVKKGSKSITLLRPVAKTPMKGESEAEFKKRIAKNGGIFFDTFSAFGNNQLENYVLPELNQEDLVLRLAHCDDFVMNTKAKINHGGDSAYYHPSDDYIQMPDTKRFMNTHSTATQNYYSTLFHELTHWTKKKERCDRTFTDDYKVLKQSYAVEELVAELGATYLCASFQIEDEPRLDHAEYLKNWLQILKDDDKVFLKAVGKAMQAIDFLLIKTVEN